MVRLECAEGTGTFACPNCHVQLEVERWDTEYNDPSVGEHDVRCPMCDTQFGIDVSVSIRAYATYNPS